MFTCHIRLQGSVPVGRGIFPVRVVLLKPGLDLISCCVALRVVVVTILLADKGVLLGHEDLGATVGDEHDHNSLVGEVVVHPSAETTHYIQVGSTVVERGLVEYACTLAALLVEELGVHAVARAELGPALGQRHVDEHVISWDGVTEDDTSLLENLAVVRGHPAGQRVTVNERLLTSRLLSVDRVSGGLLGHHVKELSQGVVLRVGVGIAGCGGHWVCFLHIFGGVPLAMRACVFLYTQDEVLVLLDRNKIPPCVVCLSKYFGMKMYPPQRR
jgi:hypothetical protein